MITKIRLILCCCFFVSLLAIHEGIALRTSNENANKSVVAVADFYDFRESATSVDLNLDYILGQLINSGIKTLAITETDSNKEGDIKQYFDEELIKYLHQMGFDILLRPKSSSVIDNNYFNSMEHLIKEFHIRYMIFDGRNIPGIHGDYSHLERIIVNNKVIVGIIEPKSQVLYEKQSGLEELIRDSNYSINRVYITPSSDLATLDRENLKHRWLRGIVDRNIRFVYVNTLKNPKLSPQEGIIYPIMAFRDLNTIITSKGYNVDSPLIKLSSNIPPKHHYILVSISLLLGSVLFATYFPGNKLKAFALAFVLLFATSNVLFVFDFIELPKYLAAYASILYPTISGVLILINMKRYEKKALLYKIASSTGIILFSNLIGAYTIVTTLSDIRYTMNLKSFVAVYEAYIIPLLLFTIIYMYIFSKNEWLDVPLITSIRNHITIKNTLFLFTAILFFYIYISRSGNESLIPASRLELQLRKVLESFFVIRPRFKEFLIGYPCLFAFVYLFSRFDKKLKLLPLGIGTVIGSISTINSFCHVFTAVTVSVQRTAYGLILGIITGILVLAALNGFVANHPLQDFEL